MAASRGRMQSIDPDHDALGHPELRDQQGPGDGETTFHQIAPSTTSGDITDAVPTHKSGDLKTSPSL